MNQPNRYSARSRLGRPGERIAGSDLLSQVRELVWSAGEATLRFYGTSGGVAAKADNSPVTEAELSAACGLLDPAHAATRSIIEAIAQIVERRPEYRTIAPDAEVWREAGILSGTLARLQGYGKDQRRRVLNDALLFASARKHGCAVLTRNVADFDFLQQLDPSGRVLFYK